MRHSIKYKTPIISSQQINQKQNFDALLKKRNLFMIKRKQKTEVLKKLGWSIAFIGLVSVSVILINYNRSKENKQFIAPVSALKYVTVHPKKANIAFKKDEQDAEKVNKGITDRPITKKPDVETNKAELNKINSPTPIDEDAQMETAFVQAYPSVGFDSLYSYLNHYLEYPINIEAADSIHGTLNVLFTIDQNGRATNITVENSLGISFSIEAIRLIESMPLWEPAIINGKPVEAKMSLPLTFELKSKTDIQR